MSLLASFNPLPGLSVPLFRTLMVVAALGLAEDAVQLVPVEGMLGDHLVDEGLHVGVAGVAA